MDGDQIQHFLLKKILYFAAALLLILPIVGFGHISLREIISWQRFDGFAISMYFGFIISIILELTILKGIMNEWNYKSPSFWPNLRSSNLLSLGLILVGLVSAVIGLWSLICFGDCDSAFVRAAFFLFLIPGITITAGITMYLTGKLTREESR